MLDEGIIGMLGREGRLIGVRQVKVINATDDGVDALLGEFGSEGDDQSSLPSTLYAVESDNEGRRGGSGFIGTGTGDSVAGSMRREVF